MTEFFQNSAGPLLIFSVSGFLVFYYRYWKALKRLLYHIKYLRPDIWSDVKYWKILQGTRSPRFAIFSYERGVKPLERLVKSEEDLLGDKEVDRLMLEIRKWKICSDIFGLSWVIFLIATMLLR